MESKANAERPAGGKRKRDEEAASSKKRGKIDGPSRGAEDKRKIIVVGLCVCLFCVCVCVCMCWQVMIRNLL